MTVGEAISYLESHGWSHRRLGLSRERYLLSALGEPQKQLTFLHVAGSNGKGSTCAMFASILQKAGYRVGLFTSPHIEQFCERIQINGQNIPDEDLVQWTQHLRPIADAMEDPPSLFELTTALALAYFAQQRCDIVVLEVGMGGMYDSTNAIPAPELTVITNIGLEHTEFLGNTLTEIAAAKAGIIKSGSHCVAYESAPEVLAVLQERCHACSIPFSLAEQKGLRYLSSSPDGQEFCWHEKAYRLSLLGEHQLRNAAVVLTGIEILQSRGWNIPDQAIAEGLAHTHWPARFEILSRCPWFILDGGHNPQCAQALSQCLRLIFPGEKVTFLIGFLSDKNYPAMIDYLQPYARQFICVTPHSPRCLSGQDLQEYLEKRNIPATFCPDVKSGIDTAIRLSAGGITVAFGSLYLAGEIRTVFRTYYSSK